MSHAEKSDNFFSNVNESYVRIAFQQIIQSERNCSKLRMHMHAHSKHFGAGFLQGCVCVLLTFLTTYVLRNPAVTVVRKLKRLCLIVIDTDI